MKTVKYRDYQAALTALKNQFEEDGINIYDMVRTPEDPIRLGVNWTACGTVLPKDAAKFGDQHKPVPVGEDGKFLATQPVSLTRTAFHYAIAGA